ncbi:hypothetical protein ACWCQN_13085 [Streptomyces sp. NPDC001984]
MQNPFAAGTGLRRYTRRHLVHDRDAARAEVLRLERAVRGLDTTVAERDTRIEQLEKDLERKARALRAHQANALKVTVRPWVRPVDPDDQPTEPAGIAVRTLRDALNVT